VTTGVSADDRTTFARDKQFRLVPDCGGGGRGRGKRGFVTSKRPVRSRSIIATALGGGKADFVVESGPP